MMDGFDDCPCCRALSAEIERLKRERDELLLKMEDHRLSKDDEIERLKAENTPTLKMEVEHLAGQIQTLLRENENLTKWHNHWHAEAARLRELLKPFAEMADQVDEWQKGCDPNFAGNFNADDLRAARAALNQTEGK